MRKYVEDLIKFKNVKDVEDYSKLLDIKYTRNATAQAAMFATYFGYPEIGSDDFIDRIKDYKKVGGTISDSFKSEYVVLMNEYAKGK
jgi:hypothetical protein